MKRTPPPAEVKRSGAATPERRAQKRDPSMNGGARGGDPDAMSKPKEKVEPPIIESNVT